MGAVPVKFIFFFLSLIFVSSSYAFGQSQAAQDAIEQIQIHHQLALNSVPGLPATITLTVQGADSGLKVRAFLLLDRELTVLPFHYVDSRDFYLASFPTPSKSLSYYFQVIPSDSAPYMTETYGVSPDCRVLERQKLFAKVERFEGQHELMRRALLLREESQRKSYILKAAKRLLEVVEQAR